MKTKVDRAIPQPRFTNTKRCAYWPDSCFLEISGIPELEDLLALRPTEVGPDPAPVPGELLGLIGHENIHWIQATGFGYGQYQAGIDQTRTEIAEAFLGIITPEQVQTLLAGRKGGRPIVIYDKRGDLWEELSLGPVALRLQRHWLGLGLLRYALDNARTIGEQVSRLRFYLGLAKLYSRVGPNVSEIALMSDPELLEAALGWAPDGAITVTNDEGRSISSASIAECSAVLDEHWFYAYQSEWCRQHSQDSDSDRWWTKLDESWRSRESTFYGDAFRIFAQQNPLLDLNESTSLATLGLICYLALNGPWLFQDVRSRPRWRDVYPPLRFCALCEAVAKVGVLPSYSVYRLSTDEFLAYTLRLCEQANVSQPEVRTPTAILPPWEASPNNDLRNLFAQCARATTELLQKYPAAVVAPSEANVYLESVLLDPALGSLVWAREAPLLILNDRMSSLHFDATQVEQFATAGLYQRLLLELLRGTGPLSKPGRPMCNRGQELARSAVRLAERRLRINLAEFPL
jgi:hypothetical protein